MKRLEKKTLHGTSNKACFRITRDCWEIICELKSTHASDSRMLLHVLYDAKLGQKSIVLEDTDIILCLGFASEALCPIC